MRKLIFRFLLGAIMATAMSMPMHAQSIASPDSAWKAATISYLGLQDGMLLFHVQYENADASKFFITIRDEEGNTIYHDMYFDRKFEKKFKLPLSDEKKLFFMITDRKSSYSQSFEINANTRIVEDVVVNEIK